MSCASPDQVISPFLGANNWLGLKISYIVPAAIGCNKFAETHARVQTQLTEDFSYCAVFISVRFAACLAQALISLTHCLLELQMINLAPSCLIQHQQHLGGRRHVTNHLHASLPHGAHSHRTQDILRAGVLLLLSLQPVLCSPDYFNFCLWITLTQVVKTT